LGRLERLPLGVFDRQIEEGEEGRRGECEGVIEALEVCAHLVAEGRPILAVVEVEVALEQVDERSIRGGLAVRGPLRVQDAPWRRQGATDALIAQA